MNQFYKKFKTKGLDDSTLMYFYCHDIVLNYYAVLSCLFPDIENFLSNLLMGN